MLQHIDGVVAIAHHDDARLHGDLALRQRNLPHEHDRATHAQRLPPSSAHASSSPSASKSFSAPPNVTFSSACASVNREGKPQRWQSAPDDALPADFAPGGTLHLIWGAESATLTPLLGRDIYGGIVHQEVLEKLVWRDLDPPFAYVPGLARSWSVSDDGTSIEFTIFEQARWSDGEPVTAHDVAFTFHQIMHPQVKADLLRREIGEIVRDCR